MKKLLKITGLDCANCAAELESILSKIDGVVAVSVSVAGQTIALEYQTQDALLRVKEAANGFEEVKVLEDDRADGKILLRLENLHCAACALDLQDEILKIAGVKSAAVDFITQTILLEADTEDAVRKTVARANKFEKVRVLNGDEVVSPKETHTGEIVRLCISAFFTLVAVLLPSYGAFAKWARYACFAVAYLTVGYPVLISTAKNVAKGRVFDENFLMTVASVGAILLGAFGGEGASGLFEGVAVMLLYQLGELLQAIAVGSSRRSVTELVKLKSERATKLTDEGQVVVRPEELQIGDRVFVKAGEKIPVDGILLSDFAALDIKPITGEAEPKNFNKGDELLAGYINASGAFEMRVVREYEQSAVKKILDLVENSTAKKAAPEKFITKFSRYYTPIVCMLALFMAFCVPALEAAFKIGGYGRYFPARVQTALSFLVISCPCALIISVPLTYFSGIGACAKRGILVKGASYLDEATKIKTVAFDKTGTLTEGNFSVVGVYPQEGVTDEELLSVAAKAEAGSTHPIAKAFEKFDDRLPPERAEELAGRGIIAVVNGKTVLAGNALLLKERGVSVQEKQSVHTVVHVARDNQYLGFLEIGDKLRKEAKSALAELKRTGIDRLVMLTGDGYARAKTIADEVGMTEVNADLLPEDKLKKAEEWKTRGGFMYVGDGVNDAPVMAASDIAVSMGKLGSGAAVEASDFVLVSDDLTAVAKAMKVAKKTRKIVAQNVVFSIAMKVAFMALGAFGWLPLSLAVFGDVGVMLIAVLNSLRVKSTKL